jgi:hypothetical protein
MRSFATLALFSAGLAVHSMPANLNARQGLAQVVTSCTVPNTAVSISYCHAMYLMPMSKNTDDYPFLCLGTHLRMWSSSLTPFNLLSNLGVRMTARIVISMSVDGFRLGNSYFNHVNMGAVRISQIL